MKNFLENILATKKTEVAARQQNAPLAKLIDRCHHQAPPKGFATALQQKSEIAVVAELKKGSPSVGVIREDFEPEVVARAYADNGAIAISVLTDEHFFYGSPSDLGRVRQVVELPVLYKDFVIDPYQIYEARAHGADAVLLVVAALDRGALIDFSKLAIDLGMDVVVEVHSKDELVVASEVASSVIGINNRDLKTFRVNRATARRLAASVPDDRPVMAESGFRKREDVERLSGCGIDAVLVGEALMRARDIGATLQQFVGVPK